MPTYTPTWLDPADVAGWLRQHSEPASTDVELERACAATEPFVERCRPDQWTTDDPAVYDPDAQVYQAAVMVAARLTRRRNSPGGQEMWADGTVAWVASRDPDVSMMLRIGSAQTPGVG